MSSSKSTNDLPPPHILKSKFKSLVFIDDLAVINNSEISLGFYYYSENLMMNEITIDKLIAFFDLLMEDCIIIKKDNSAKIKAIVSNNILSTPYAPSEQMLGALLFLKLSAIAGEELLIDHLTISSDLSRGLQYTINEDSPELGALVPPKDEWWELKDSPHEPWWNRPDTATNDSILENNEIFKGEFTWEELFKDDLKEAETFNLDPKKGKFQIIKGGKNES
jgi:hypothetical protein